MSAFIAIALVLVVTGPRLSRALATRPRHVANHPFALPSALFVCGVCGYFGAAQGILLLAVLGLALSASLQEINGVKNVLALFVNLVAGAVFAVFAHVAWWPVLLIAGGSVIGGQIGADVGRKLPEAALRGTHRRRRARRDRPSSLPRGSLLITSAVSGAAARGRAMRGWLLGCSPRSSPS